MDKVAINMKDEKTIPADKQEGFWTCPDGETGVIEKVDYDFVDHPELSDHYSIKLISGPYNGVTYTYGNVRLKEFERASDKEMECHFFFAFKINDPGSLEKDELRADTNFKNYIGYILEDILDKQEFKFGKKLDPDA